MTYINNDQNDILPTLGEPLADDPLYVNGVDDAFEEALGDLLFVEGIDFRFGAFGLVTWGTCPLGSHKLGGT